MKSKKNEEEENGSETLAALLREFKSFLIASRLQWSFEILRPKKYTGSVLSISTKEIAYGLRRTITHLKSMHCVLSRERVLTAKKKK